MIGIRGGSPGDDHDVPPCGQISIDLLQTCPHLSLASVARDRITDRFSSDDAEPQAWFLCLAEDNLEKPVGKGSPALFNLIKILRTRQSKTTVHCAWRLWLLLVTSEFSWYGCSSSAPVLRGPSGGGALKPDVRPQLPCDCEIHGHGHDGGSLVDKFS